jgi:mannosylglycerate hydrolase
MQTLFIVSHTHWDREWYAPFQVFRARLIRCIDQLLAIFETDSDYQYFMLDGQTIVLEDYLEVRPEREQILRDLVIAGKLEIGPWYILPDEFLVSGEALIRNLQRGIRLARDFGNTMKAGYIPDPFGHISQMPQILRGFDLNTAILRRGLADEPTELWWQAPDGTRVLLCYLRNSYDNLAFVPRDPAGFIEALEEQRASLTPHTLTENLLLMNGTDHMEPWANLPHLIETARQHIHDAQIVHASLPMYVAQVQKEIETKQLDLPVVQGELRNPKRHHLLPGVLSTRMWIKQRNARAQMLLEKWAEPLTALAALNFEPSPLNLALGRLAWKYLLQNQPHDSICGCSVDQVHREMAIRFDWVEQIAEQVIGDSLTTLALQIDTRSTMGEQTLVVFNPTCVTRTDCVQTILDVPDKFSIFNEQGNPLPFHVTHRSGKQTHVEFIAPDVPGLGYRTFYSTPRAIESKRLDAFPPPRVIENEFYRIQANANDGTLTIWDKTTGAEFSGVHRFVDGGDRGDLYNYCPPENDTLIRQPNAPPRILTEHSPARQSLHITMTYRLPAQLGADRTARAAEWVDEKIETTISIYPGVRRIDFQTMVDNRARDHRLGVEFPAPFVTAHACADQAFDVVARAITPPAFTPDWIEQPRPEAPMQNFVSLSDGTLGMTLATRGLHEYAARSEANQTILTLTLLRCIGWLSRDDLSTRQGHAGPAIETPGAQEIGMHRFEYALIHHRGDWRNAFDQAFAFATPMRAITTDAHAGTLPASASFVRVTPREFVISAIKMREDNQGLIVRGYNIGNEPIDARIELWKSFARASRVNLNEEEIAPIELYDEREIRINVRGKEIVSMLFEAI